MRIQKIAEICGYEFWGEDCDIRTVSYADTALEDSLAIVHTQKEFSSTNARAVLMEPRLIITDKTVLIVSDTLDVAVVKIAMLLVQNGEAKLYNRNTYNNINGFYVADNVVIDEGTNISPNVFIDEDVKIGKCCTIEPNVQIKGGSVIGDDVHLMSGCIIGADSCCYYYDTELKTFPGIGKVVIGDGTEIGCHTVIQRGTFSDTVIGSGNKIGNLVDIGHDVRIGNHCKIVSQTGIAGHASIGNMVMIYGQTGIINHVTIGDRAVIMAQSLVTKNVPVDEKVSGRFARKHSEELRRQASISKLYPKFRKKL